MSQSESLPVTNILLVDDDPQDLEVLEISLASLRQTLVRASSGKEALRNLLRSDFSVIIMDVMMTEMDGFETVKLIRQRIRSVHTPIIFITAYGVSLEEMHQGYELGAVDYIFKPFNPEILKAKVGFFIDLYQKNQLIQRQADQLAEINLLLKQQVTTVLQAQEDTTHLYSAVEWQAQELTPAKKWITENLKGDSVKISILLVDDHPESLVALESVLADPEYNLVKTLSANEALQWTLNTEFAVIIMDVKMPGLNGFQTATQIHEKGLSRNTPVIFVTGYGKSEMEVFQGYGVGAVDYIFKPYDPEIIRAKVAVFVKLYRQQQQLQNQANELILSNQRLAQEIIVSQQKQADILQLNQVLEEQTAQLANINKELEAFAYSVSHDLRAPLRRIIGFTSILADEAREVLSESCLDHLQKIISSGERMSQLIDGLLTFSRLGHTSLIMQSFKLTPILQEVTQEISEKIKEKAASLTLVEMENMPAVLGDRRLVIEILSNLIGNALIYSSPTVPPRIVVTAQSENGEVYIRVNDNGIGIPVEFQEKIFGVFQRLHNEKQYPGTGIGLALVRKAVSLMNGRVWVESSEVDKGSTFCVVIPKG